MKNYNFTKILEEVINQFNFYNKNINKKNVLNTSIWHALDFTKKARAINAPFEIGDTITYIYEVLVKANKTFDSESACFNTYYSVLLKRYFCSLLSKYINRKKISNNDFLNKIYELHNIDNYSNSVEENYIKNIEKNRFISDLSKEEKLIAQKIIEGDSKKEMYNKKISTRRKLEKFYSKIENFKNSLN